MEGLTCYVDPNPNESEELLLIWSQNKILMKIDSKCIQASPLDFIFLTNYSICLSFDFIISYNLLNFKAKICVILEVPLLALWGFRHICLCFRVSQQSTSSFCFVSIQIHLFERVLLFLLFLLADPECHLGYLRYFGNFWCGSGRGSLFSECFSEKEKQLFDLIGYSIC